MMRIAQLLILREISVFYFSLLLWNRRDTDAVRIDGKNFGFDPEQKQQPLRKSLCHLGY